MLCTLATKWLHVMGRESRQGGRSDVRPYGLGTRSCSQMASVSHGAGSPHAASVLESLPGQ